MWDAEQNQTHERCLAEFGYVYPEQVHGLQAQGVGLVVKT